MRGQLDSGLLVADDKDVAKTGGEGVLGLVLDVDNIEVTLVAVAGNNGADTANVTTTSDHHGVANLELEDLSDLASGQVQLNGVVDGNEGIRVADGAAIGGNDVRDALSTDALAADLADLELYEQ